MLLLPLASSRRDWKEALLKGSWLTILGIGAMTALALAGGTVQWAFKALPNAGYMYFSNLFLTSIPEEAFYRGFIQSELVRRFKNGKVYRAPSSLVNFHQRVFRPSAPLGLTNSLELASTSATHWDKKFSCQNPQNLTARGIGKAFALIVSSLIFTAAHLYWSPSLAIFGFVFLAGLLYGGVYMLSGRIESAILCHFLLNFIHMTFFTYRAL